MSPKCGSVPKPPRGQVCDTITSPARMRRRKLSALSRLSSRSRRVIGHLLFAT